MSTELAEVPREELERARRVIQNNLINAGAALVIGAVVVTTGTVLYPSVTAAVASLLCGTLIGLRGAVHVVRALRARATVRRKLGDRALPTARLLRAPD